MPKGIPSEWPSPAEVEELWSELGSQVAVAKRLGKQPGSVASFCARHGITDPSKDEEDVEEGLTHNGDGSATIVSAAQTKPAWTPEELLEKYGLGLDEWRIVRQRANAWQALTSDKAHGDNRVVTLHQLRIELVPTEWLIGAVDPSGYQAPKPRKRKATNAKPLDVEVIGDHHAPYNDKVFHALYLEYLDDEQPDLIEVNGDLGDYPTPSRHRPSDVYNASANECLSASYGILRDYREVCPKARIRLKKGNHEERLEHLIVDNARALHKIAPAEEELAALDLRRLLRLDELEVEYVPEPWDQAKSKLSKKLTVRHGFTTSRNAGNVMLDKLAGSTLQGHDHRLEMKLRTEHGVDGELEVRLAMSGACACEIAGGLGYVSGGEPDWQNGSVKFRVWPDGDFHATPGIYVPGRFLAPNGKRYVA